MYSYFHKTDVDSAFYDKNIRSRLPAFFIDGHAHFNLPEHIASVSTETITGDWALESGKLMSYEDALDYFAIMFPEKTYSFVALPWPLRDADTVGNNKYISFLAKEKRLRGLYTLRPEYSVDQIERDYIEGGFCGFKPYPYLASAGAVKGADVSIFDFMTHEQFALADKLNAGVKMHLPRAGRLPDPDNISEIRVILDRYPNIKLDIAHFGRCFVHGFFERALEALGEDVHRFWFDTSAVLNPKVYELAAENLDHRRIIFGTDSPIMLWHGKREWDEHNYYNLCREDFSWNRHKYPEEEADYTYYIYEQIDNIFTAFGDDPGVIEDIFRRNAETVYGV